MNNKTKTLLDVTNAPNNLGSRQLKSVTHVYTNGHSKSWSFENNVLRYEDSDDRWSERVYDLEGRLVEISSSDGQRKKNTYNEKGIIVCTEKTDGKWKIRKWNDEGQLIYEERHDGFWIVFHYDMYGNIAYRETSLNPQNDETVVIIKGEKYKLVKL